MDKESTKMANLKKRIGENIRKIRQQNQVEVKTLCNDLEISPAAYSNIERGVTDISISRVMQLADYFAVHYAQILAVDNTTIYQFTQHSNDHSTQHNQQVATLSTDGDIVALQQAKEENQYLREQNNKLLDMLAAKNG